MKKNKTNKRKTRKTFTRSTKISKPKFFDFYSLVKQYGGDIDDDIYNTNYSPPQDLDEDDDLFLDENMNEEQVEDDEDDEKNGDDEDDEDDNHQKITYTPNLEVNDIDGIETVEYDRERLMNVFESLPDTIFEMDPTNGLYFNHTQIFEENEDAIKVVILYEFSIYKTTLLNRIPVPLIDNDLLSSGKETFYLPKNMSVQQFLDSLMYSANKTIFPKLGLLSVPSYKVNGITENGRMFNDLKRDDSITEMPKRLHIDIEYRLRENA